MTGVSLRDVGVDEDGMRLDRWFRLHYPQLGHGKLEKLLRKGQIRVDGGRVKAAHRLAKDQSIRVPPLGLSDQQRPANSNQDKPSKKTAEQSLRDRTDLQNMVIFEDDSLLVLNKPHGLAVQGGTGTSRHIDGMLDSWGHNNLGTDQETSPKPRLVHRLDRDTAGVLVLAKTRAAATKLGEAFQKQNVEKIYWALTAGVPRPREGTINRPIAKRMVHVEDEEALEKMVPADGEDAKRAITDFQTVDDAGAGVGFVIMRPRTGRTHQLRVHCAVLGTPIIGDGKYGGALSKVEGLSGKLHLFCHQMAFSHPKSNKPMTFTAPLSGHMLTSWKFFGFDQNAIATWPDQL